MDQISVADKDEVSDELASKNDFLAHSSKANVLEYSSNVMGDRIDHNINNDESKPREGSSNSVMETENLISVDKNDVSTSCVENVIPNGDDSPAAEKNTTSDALRESEKSDNFSNGNAEAESSTKQLNTDKINVDENVNNTVTELPSSAINAHVPTLACATSNTNADSSLAPNGNASDVSKIQNFHDSRDEETNIPVINDETLVSNHRNNFVPTIVEIRGGCTDVLEKTSDRSTLNSFPTDARLSIPSEIPNLNIVRVLGGCKDKETNVERNTSRASTQVYTISDNEETAAIKFSDNAFNNDITIKQEPSDSVPDNDCVYMGTENNCATFTSEVFIKEEKTSNVESEDQEVICIETTSKIPSPIPIKTESNIEVESQQRSGKTEKFTAKKRLTRSSSKSDDCIILSSSSDMDSLSDSRKRHRLSQNPPYSTAGYTCHLCNTTFQEHELLNEHMILHRNNSLIEAKVQNRSKASKLKSYSCNICQKQLSTSQSLQQHVMIHKNEKPLVCHTCNKDFRHMSNYRMHLQKHKAEQRRRNKMQQKDGSEQFDRSVVRGVDFGRLVGPLFMKESLLHQEQDTISSTSKNQSSNATTSSFNTAKKPALKPLQSVKESPRQSRLLFDQPSFKTNENPTTSISSAVIIRRRDASSDSRSEEECVAVKSFNNIESVVMNASKIIVKLDNLDTSVLKRKLQTPDISIDQAPKKCKIMLSPIAEKCNVKLDEIENIPIDMDSGDMDLPSKEPMAGDYHIRCLNDSNDKKISHSSAQQPHGTLTDNELFELLNDERDTTTATSVSVDDGKNGNSSRTLQSEFCKVDNAVKTTDAPATKCSNVIFVETPVRYEASCNEDEKIIDDKLNDVFDTAFRKVALRRLTLLKKRADENAGKVKSCYLLGPLFWRKVLKHARKCVSNTGVKTIGSSDGNSSVDVTFGTNDNGTYNGGSVKTWTNFGRSGGRSRFDDRRTNDPIKLQARAESKFQCLLDKAKMLNNLNTLNLVGPLFWRRTLQLAGVRHGEDLRIHMNSSSPTLENVEFVNDDGKSCELGSTLLDKEEQKTCSPQSSPSDQLRVISTAISVPDKANDIQQLCGRNSTLAANDTVADDVVKLPNQTQSSSTSMEQQSLSRDDGVIKNAETDVTPLKMGSILYESLTKPKENQQQSIITDSLPPSIGDSTSLLIANSNTTVQSSISGHSKAQLIETCSADKQNNKCNDLPSNATVALGDNSIAKLATIDSGSIVLNVDGGGNLQLIPANNDETTISEAGQNFVLVSDGSGAMQYMVNMPNENYANFELIGDGGGSDQLAYAIQFDGETYAAVQFVPDSDSIQLQSNKGVKEAQLQVDSKAATYLVANAGATATAVVQNPNHIGKELSDFLNLDYGNLLKNGTADQSMS